MEQLITEIYNDGRYKSICKQIAKRKEQAEELHSTFILTLLEMKGEQKQFLQTMKDSNTLEVYCVGIINNLWSRKNRGHGYKIGTTSPLFEYTSTFDITSVYNKDDEEWQSPEEFFSKPSEEYDIRIDYLSKRANEIIERECNHNDIERYYRAKVFKYSYTVCDNPNQLSKETGIPKCSVWYTCKKFAKELKEELKKL